MKFKFLQGGIDYNWICKSKSSNLGGSRDIVPYSFFIKSEIYSLFASEICPLDKAI